MVSRLRTITRIPVILLATVAGTGTSVGLGLWYGGTVAWADPPPAAEKNSFVLHVTGIGGKRTIDYMLVHGLADGGVNADFQIYDWTGDDSGMVALGNPKIHDREATKVAELIESHYRAHPNQRLIVTCHSGGAAITAWAMERLPADVKIDTWLMLAPALSPKFDLSKALAHVQNKAFAFTSENDAIVLGVGCRMFGTMDRVKTEAAGKVGFQKPESADDTQYAKLVQVPYDADWMRFGNIGDHIGALMRPFVKRVLAPTLLDGAVPVTHAPTTEPGPKGPA